jgi:flavin reductase (DIM6/NTAB) family NADH-FMN oxidoreductase RutF
VNRLALILCLRARAFAGIGMRPTSLQRARLTPISSEAVAPPRVLECPIQLEAKLVRVNPVMTDKYDYSVHERSSESTLEGIVCLELRIVRVHADPSILMSAEGVGSIRISGVP